MRLAVDGGGTAVLGQVLTGLGGVGKTQLAADHARRAWEAGQIEILVWVVASSRAAIIAAYVQAAAEICGTDAADPEEAAAIFLAWLRAKQHRWLVVLDDLADPADIRGLWPPDVRHGRTLVTTRRRDAALTGAGRHLLQIGVFTPDQAAAYLDTAVPEHHRTEEAELAGLASDLGYLPLALSQAATYLSDQGTSVAAYRRLLADRTRTLSDAVPEQNALPDDQGQTLAALWSLSIERADQLRPAGLARPMLQLTAMLDPNGIPQTALTSPPALTYLNDHRTASRQAVPVTAEEAVGALRALHRMNLIDHTSDSDRPAVRVHQLVQRATRDALGASHRAGCIVAAADALVLRWPAIEPDPDLARGLRSNASALAIVAEQALFAAGVHEVLFRLGGSLGDSGQLRAAEAHFRGVVQAANEALGPDHAHTLVARHDLAHWQGEAGDPVGAAQAFANLLPDRLRVLGPDHPDTLSTRNDLAYWQGEAGDPVGAAQAFANLLPDRLRVLGPDHPQTLSNRSNLARLIGEAGDPAAAAAAFSELVAAYQQVLGPDDPNTLITRHNLAHLWGKSGHPALAVDTFADLLPDFLRVLGPDHPVTLTGRHSLAYWQGQAGDPAGAADALSELLNDRLRVLGADHPDTLTTRSYLAYWRGRAGDPVGAAEAAAQLLADRSRVLGPDHPDTLTTRSHFARWQGQAGDPVGAAETAAQLLADRSRVLGPDHPDTLTTRSDLAHWRGMAGDRQGAADDFDELLIDCMRSLGSAHPVTLAVRDDLARWHERAVGDLGSTQ
ncbi:tetratricopeptide repeat protein [Streptomyces sp. NPDC059917]|uniref:tetratricopeptide repeat protein n=1 Tax=Streptomyces sp. NPDC059917 TaxID=3347002 RepID=UPI003656DE30